MANVNLKTNFTVEVKGLDQLEALVERLEASVTAAHELVRQQAGEVGLEADPAESAAFIREELAAAKA